ncbi:ammonia channel protein, partial [Cupriavidus pauculus]
MKTWIKRFLTAGAMALALGTAGLGLSTHAVAQDKPAAEASAPAATAAAGPAAAAPAAPAAPAAAAAPAEAA